MPKQYINPTSLFDSMQYGFSQIVVALHGRTVYISGQVGWNSQQENIGDKDISHQTREAFRNLQTAIEAAGGKLNDIVSLRLYIVKYTSEKGSSVGTVLREFFGTVSPPASTWIGVHSLAREEFLIEVEAVGVIE